MPLLGPVLGLALPENDFTAALNPQERKYALEALLPLLGERAAAFALQSSTEGKTYDVTEVGQTVRRALDEMGRNMPSIPPPALMMVAGAVLLDIAGRRKRKAQNA